MMVVIIIDLIKNIKNILSSSNLNKGLKIGAVEFKTVSTIKSVGFKTILDYCKIIVCTHLKKIVLFITDIAKLFVILIN